MLNLIKLKEQKDLTEMDLIKAIGEKERRMKASNQKKRRRKNERGWGERIEDTLILIYS